MDHKTSSPNAIAEGKTPSPNVVAGGKKERKEMEEMKEGRRRKACSNFKYHKAVVLNNGYLINDKAIVEDNYFLIN